MRVTCTKCGRFCRATGEVLFVVYVCANPVHGEIVIYCEHADPDVLARLNRKSLGLGY